MNKEELQSWIRQQLDFVVSEVGSQGALEDALLEVKPAWTLPMRLLVGMIREQSNAQEFRWFICGEVPFDHLPSEAASTPRDAIRHFAMKWQLDAEKLDADAAAELTEHAEAIYALVEVDELWK